MTLPRHSKTFRYLPITRTNFVMSVGEFSLRKSVLESTKTREIKEDEKVKFDVIRTWPRLGDVIMTSPSLARSAALNQQLIYG